jgi:hypothetical protein
VRAFNAEHLDQLVAGLQQEGEAAAAAVNAAGEALTAASRRRREIARQILETVSSAGLHVTPDDVTRSAPGAEEAARAAARLLSQGGEKGRRLRRDPREPMAGPRQAEVSAA